MVTCRLFQILVLIVSTVLNGKFLQIFDIIILWREYIEKNKSLNFLPFWFWMVQYQEYFFNLSFLQMHRGLRISALMLPRLQYCFECLYFFFLIFIYLFIYFAAPGPCCFVWGLSSCGEQGLLFVAGCSFSSQWLLLFWSKALGTRASVVAVHRLGSCGLQALEHGLSSCDTRA